MNKNKHLTLDDRIEIQECLTKGMTFKAIANRIEKNQTTVSREVKAHAQSYSNGHTRIEGICPKLLKSPFVCNGCEMKSREKAKVMSIYPPALKKVVLIRILLGLRKIMMHYS